MRMFKDSEDLHGLQTANSKNLGWYIDTTGLTQSNKTEKWHFPLIMHDNICSILTGLKRRKIQVLNQ